MNSTAGRGRGRPMKAVTPVAKKARVSSLDGMSEEAKVLYASVNTLLRFSDDTSESEKIDMIYTKTKALTTDSDVINEVYDALVYTMNERNEAVKELKQKVNELIPECPLTPAQRLLMDGLKNMDEKQLNQFSGFLLLARENVKYINVSSPKINPHYKREEIIREGLEAFQEADTSNGFDNDLEYAQCSSQSSNSSSSSTGIRLGGLGLGVGRYRENNNDSQETVAGN